MPFTTCHVRCLPLLACLAGLLLFTAPPVAAQQPAAPTKPAKPPSISELFKGKFKGVLPASYHGATDDGGEGAGDGTPSASGAAPNSRGINPYPLPENWPGPDLYRQTDDDVLAKSWGCVNCHQEVHDMHSLPTVKLGCTDCHGGDAKCGSKEGAHVAPRFPNAWPTSGNPVRSYTLLNHESPEFIRFVNPGDLRIAHVSCGGCHAQEVLQVRKSMMTNGCMLWGAALYNNGSVPNKAPRYGESYSMLGSPQRIQNVWAPDEVQRMAYDINRKGMVPFLDPLPRFEISQPGNVLRIFEMGGRFRPEVGIPERQEEPGRPRARLSLRGLGTENRTDPVFVGLQKTRLLDPTLNFLGTNDHAGDFRSSGCSACHVVYANDRSAVHSGPYAKYGNNSFAAADRDDFVQGVDPTIPNNEPGHPITHRFTTAVPTSQCIVCHMHPGTNVLNSYLGYMWWDNETDGDLMYPAEQKYPTSEEITAGNMNNPEEASLRGNWGQPEFLARLPELNPLTKHTQFADFHGHGWAFRAVFKKDRKGNLLDPEGDVVSAAGGEKLYQAVVQPGEPYVPADPTKPQSATLAECKKMDDMPVHLMDIHMEKGMHCVDCHFVQDSHGDTKLYGEVRAAIEITCVDCHGTADESIPEKIDRLGRMPTTGPAAAEAGSEESNGRNLLLLRSGGQPRKPRFEVRHETRARPDGSLTHERVLIQRALVEEGREWRIVQTKDTTQPNRSEYNAKSHLAKTVRWEFDAAGELQMVWGGTAASAGSKGSGHEVVGNAKCAHQTKNMSCITCHTSWNPSCFGCHLSQKANRKMPNLHNDGDVTRNYTSYNFQTLRDDVFMLARDGVASGNRINPARSSCAVHVSSYNNNRESIYVQQQTISGGGMSGVAFSTNVPHTVRGKNPRMDTHMPAGTSETKLCSDCHVSKDNDNNAVIAQLLMQGTNYTNFIGRYCWIAAGEHGLEAAVVTERDEPQAVIGSSLHHDAFPDFFKEHEENEHLLKHAHEHPGVDILDQIRYPLQKPEVLMVQPRGEYLYAACGCGGLRVFDIAFIDDKAFAERITSAPVSPKGQRFFVPTKYATAVAAPTTIAPDPTRKQMPENLEQAVHAIYGSIYVTDKYEGLIVVGAGTLLDGNPLNNFLERQATFNPDGVLCGARAITIVGTYAYICADAGWVIVDIADPKTPKLVNVVHEHIEHPVSVQVQFRYAFVCDEHHGLHIFDVTDLTKPVHVSEVDIHECHNVYVARTYAYVAAGEEGLVIVDVTNPHKPFIDQHFDAGGCINECHDVKLGITYTSEFAYLADGENGLRVVQLTSPETPGNSGFSPRPTPELIATYKLPHEGHALQIGEGVDRDRAVDESGNQIAVFGRVGARPLNLSEQLRMYRKPLQDGTWLGDVFKVSDDPYDTVYRRTRDVPPAPHRQPAPLARPPLLGPFRR